MLRAFSVFALTLLVASLAYAATVSGPAPNFTLQSNAGGQVSLASLKGKVVMVNFWATWCVPCRQEMPHLQALYEKYNGLGFELLAVNVEKNNAEGARKWLQETPVTFPVLFDPENQVTKLYKVQTMPSTVIIGRDGTMRFMHNGYKPGYENDYQTQVRALLRE
ncbi:MAG TPA: TlpA disulfide reductase family protein [Gammaproteobacteria bacterium]|nr:TlpA disulfide reductase family protein [Gammaproteobacteria bacterium]